MKKILESFKGAKGDESRLPSQFKLIADYFFYNGYLLVNNVTKIYLRDIEFYYHEENGPIKDPIVYHRNTKKKPVDYFPKLGIINTHQSGIDITFENEKEKYRASFLIRGYNMINNDSDVLIDEYETRSTYLYEALFMQHSLTEGLSIKWIESENTISPKDIIQTMPCISGCLYDNEEIKIPYDNISIPTQKKKYNQDLREWRYIRQIKS